MSSFFHSLRAKSWVLLFVALVLVSTACDGGNPGKNTLANSAHTLTIGEQEGTEAQLLTTMYMLMLQHAGFKVAERALPGNSDGIFKAISNGQIDLYPEFTAAGLEALGLNSTGNAQQDYLQIKQGYEGKYHLSWLDLAPLDDTYGICTTQDESKKLGNTTISNLVKQFSQLTIAASSDGAKYGVDQLQATYGLSFKKVFTYSREDLALSALNSGTQNLAICHTSSPAIVSNELVLLQDDKHAFSSDNPAPIVRDSLLRSVPQIITVLNKLAPYLTTEVSQQLQSQVVNGKQSVSAVSTRFLQSKGLL